MSTQDDMQMDSNGGDVLSDRPLIVASNRGPVTFTRERDGTFTSRKGSGGVVTAVSSIARDRKPIWVACPARNSRGSTSHPPESRRVPRYCCRHAR